MANKKLELSSLLDDLKTNIGGKELSREEREKLIDKRVDLPEDFERDEVKLDDMNFGNKGPSPLYHLLISASPKRSLDEVQPVLDEVFRMSKVLKLERGIADVQYSVFWTPAAFQQERKLTGLFFSEVEVEGRAYTVDPTKVRIGFNAQSHKIEATTAGNQLLLTAKGNYTPHLEEMIKLFNIQFAKLRLDKNDAKAFLKKAENTRLGKNKYVKAALERAVEPKQYSTLSIGLGGPMFFGNKEIIELPSVGIKFLREFEKEVGKQIFNAPPDQETQVMGFSKIYGPIELLKGKRLKDLKTLVRMIPALDLGIAYNQPLLTSEQAKELLGKEIEIISKGYETLFGLGLNSHMWRGSVVKRLAREHFGDEIVENFDEMNATEYADILKSKGYKPTQSFEKEPEYIAKERHLLEFFKQSYDKNPGKSIEKFREYYQNSEPEMEIAARLRGKDASKLEKIQLPKKSKLFSFGITEHMHDVTPYSNDLSISRLLASSDDIHFWSRTSLDNPILLHLQGYVCKKMGINFK